ncbi:glycosyltransferase [Candidatus Pelagibacter bacterium]|nr:glycosyltransferase [Candidatus Pelagibacter bacterium]
MKIIHIINSLKKGGAEGNLYRLCKFHKKKYKINIDITIITLINNGFYEAELKKLGIKIFSLNLNKLSKFFDFIKYVIKLRKFIKKQSPDIIQSWMYHSNFITLFIPKKFYNELFWNIRHAELNTKISKKMTIFLSIICGLFSKVVPKKIIYCSEKSINFHENKHFYSKYKSSLVYNGYSDKSYSPLKHLRSDFRVRNKIQGSDIIIGYAGRYAKQKNIASMLLAFSKITKNYKNVYLYMVGRDISIQNKELITSVNNLKISNKIYFLNEQKNLLEFYNGIDFLLLTSHSESFPNVIAESMLCSTPVLSSNAGCSKKIINSCGFIMSNNDHRSIYKNLNRTINFYKYKRKEWKLLKKNSRLQIQKNFSIPNMANTYMKNWIF